MKVRIKDGNNNKIVDKLHKQLKEEAHQRGMTMNAYIISILWSKRVKDGQ